MIRPMRRWLAVAFLCIAASANAQDAWLLVGAAGTKPGPCSAPVGATVASRVTSAQVIAELEGTPTQVVDRSFRTGHVLFCSELSRQLVYEALVRQVVKSPTGKFADYAEANATDTMSAILDKAVQSSSAPARSPLQNVRARVADKAYFSRFPKGRVEIRDVPDPQQVEFLVSQGWVGGMGEAVIDSNAHIIMFGGRGVFLRSTDSQRLSVMAQLPQCRATPQRALRVRARVRLVPVTWTQRSTPTPMQKDDYELQILELQQVRGAAEPCYR